ncbi:MAG: hypothetical protein AAFQ80_11325 [Cyanobacteria bacterium J06621_8]
MHTLDLKFQEVENCRWGIYSGERLLATVGSYEACQSISESLSHDISDHDSLKAAIAYQNAINKSLIIK